MRATVEHVGVDLGGGHVLVAEQFLHRADVGASLEQVGGKAMAQRVRGHWLVEAGLARGAAHRRLQHLLVDVVASAHASERIQRNARGRKQVLPSRLGRRVGILACQRVGQVHPAQPTGQVACMQPPHLGPLPDQVLAQRRRQHRHPVLSPLAVAHRQLVALQVHVLEPQPHTFHQPQPAAVEQPGHQRLAPGQALQQAPHLRPRQHYRQPLRTLGPDHVLHPRQLDPQHLPVQEQQRRQRLVLGAGCNPVAAGQAGEKRLHRRPVQIAWMPWKPGPDIPANPVHIRLLGAQAVVLEPQPAPHLVQQPRLPFRCYTP